MTMAVSELSAVGAPSTDLANRLNCLFGPCGLVSIMAVCVAVASIPSNRFRFGVYCFATMEWLCNVGYTCFPWVADAPNNDPQNVMHLVVTVLVVVFSLAALMLILLGAKKARQRSLGIWVGICLAAMLIGPIGTGLLPRSVFGLYERLGTFSVVVFNAVLGMYLLKGKFEEIMIDTSRLKIYAASKEQMEAFIATQTVDVLKCAYTEMLDGAMSHSDQWEWYAIWMIELKDGTHIGELCFKGLSEEGVSEIGYGIDDEHQGRGYATEAVAAIVNWALEQPGVIHIKAETEEPNIASQKVLKKVGFVPTGEIGEEGSIYMK